MSVTEVTGIGPALLQLIETCAGGQQPGSTALRVTASVALSGGGFVWGCPGTPHHCPSLCPDNVICPLSTEYQVSVRSTEINLMSPEDMQLIF